MNEYIDVTCENIACEHICCAIGDKKHVEGVEKKKEWLKTQTASGHVFRKLNAQGKVFIEYAPLENAWTPIVGGGYVYIQCLWVSGSFSGHGYGAELLNGCIEDAKKQGRRGVCVMSSKKKKPFLADKKFFEKYGFSVCDTAGEFELLALSFEKGDMPRFTDKAKTLAIEEDGLTVFYDFACPFTNNCVSEVEAFCKANAVPLHLHFVDTLEKAKALPCPFNNWAIFLGGKFATHQLQNANSLKKLLGK